MHWIVQDVKDTHMKLTRGFIDQSQKLLHNMGSFCLSGDKGEKTVKKTGGVIRKKNNNSCLLFF